MQELYKRLRDFKLSGMALTLEDRLSYARSKKLPYEETLPVITCIHLIVRFFACAEHTC